MIRTLPQSHIQSLHEIENGYWWFSGRVYWAMRLLKQLEAERGTPFHQYADLGCGVGGFAKQLRQNFDFSDTLLVDGDPKVVEAMTPAEKSDFLYRDLQRKLDLPFSPDLITCMDVLEHLEDDAFFLSEAHANLKRGGAFLLSVPHHPGFYSYWDKAVGHYRRYGRRELRVKLEAAGFRVRSLTPMWAFMTPILLVRKFQSDTKDASEAVFPKVPSWLNAFLFALSKTEYALKRTTPFGTSLIACCEKP